ncbi:uncharacterized protein LOC106164426 [Lingula anatina]|uniref:Uncharacterized protein LOC106164426 n=1 Tax=Lingula anatina TaxID=7574 RepID=A0A1S3IIR4_LINAN|nr:uncharacterized protein LOC106164426 [Lingula anatina]|eukprot:XP_013397776.1 uncharacterized protein LOC106164426 [Lingula anatina]
MKTVLLIASVCAVIVIAAQEVCGETHFHKLFKRVPAHGVPRQFLFSCEGKKNGYHADRARLCHVFYLCLDGKKFQYHCAQGYLFDEDLGHCYYEEQVSCEMATIPPPPTTQERKVAFLRHPTVIEE